MALKGFLENFMFHCLRLPTCEELEIQTYDYAQETLPEKTLIRFKKHIKLCKNCAQFLENYLKIVKLGPNAQMDKLDQGIESKILQSLLSGH